MMPAFCDDMRRRNQLYNVSVDSNAWTDEPPTVTRWLEKFESNANRLTSPTPTIGWMS